MLEEVSSKNGTDPFQKDGKVKYQSMNEVYTEMMRRSLEDDKNDGGEDNG